MAFIVEDGSGLANSTSYLSVADADTYFADHRNPTQWSGASTAEKELALMDGTQYLDMMYSQRWKGRRTDDDQALDWPRFLVFDRDRFVFDSDEIPQPVKDATAEAALESIIQTNLVPTLTNPGSVKRKLSKVGPITTETEYTGGNSPVARFRRVEMLLRDVLQSAGRMTRS